MKKKLPLFWGYLDWEGVIRIKRYTDDRAIANCERMPFCKGIFDPFYAETYSDAKAKITQFLNEQQAKEGRA